MTNRISTGIKKSFLLLVAKLLVVSTGYAQSAESFLSSYPEYDSLNDSLMLAQYMSTSYCTHEISFWATGGIATPETNVNSMLRWVSSSDFPFMDNTKAMTPF